MEEQHNEDIQYIPPTKEICEYHIDVIDKNHLKRIYMPYINQGGIFITTNKHYDLNDEVTFSIKFLEESEVFIIQGKVVWINPKYTQGGSPQGIGVQFLDEKTHKLHDKIENYLAGFSGTNESSDAM